MPKLDESAWTKHTFKPNINEECILKKSNKYI